MSDNRELIEEARRRAKLYRGEPFNAFHFDTGDYLDQLANALEASLEKNKRLEELLSLRKSMPYVELETCLAEAVEVLEWYADPVLAYALTQVREPRSAVHADKGQRARDFLSKIEGKRG